MDLDRDARRVLTLARQQRTPTAADRARVARRLALGLGLGAAATATAAAQKTTTGALAAKTAASSAMLKWSIAGTVLAAVAAGGYVASPAFAPRTTPPRAASAPVVAAPRPVAPAPAEDVPAAQPAPAAATATAAVPAAREHAEVPARAPRPASASALAQVELLHAAQAAWRAGDAANALALLGRHRARWPRSELRLERDALQVLTLCDLGRRSEASRTARRLLARAPHSPLRASIEESCAFE